MAPPRGVEPRALPARAPAEWPSGPAGSFERGEVVEGWQGRARGSVAAYIRAPATHRGQEPPEAPPSHQIGSRDALDTAPPLSIGTATINLGVLAIDRDIEIDVGAKEYNQLPPVDVGIYIVGHRNADLLSPELPLDSKSNRQTSARAPTTKRGPSSGVHGVCGQMAARAGRGSGMHSRGGRQNGSMWFTCHRAKRR